MTKVDIYSGFLGAGKTTLIKKLIAEGEESETLRKQVMYQDYINRGFKHEKAVKMLQKILDDGTEIEEAKEAYESCKEFYKSQIDDFQKEMESRKAETKKQEEKQEEKKKDQNPKIVRRKNLRYEN